MAEAVLRATVRLSVDYESVVETSPSGWVLTVVQGTAVGHATLVHERYLVTHNHFPVETRQWTAREERAGGVRLTVSTVEGVPVLEGLTTRQFDVVALGSEWMVLDLHETGAVLFAAFGLESAPMAGPGSVAPPLGAELAQVNWDGAQAFVRWVTLTERVDEPVPGFVLEGAVRQGASGGGVFWNGVLVANNWKVHEVYRADNGELLEAHTVAAGLLRVPALPRPDVARLSGSPRAAPCEQSGQEWC